MLHVFYVLSHPASLSDIIEGDWLISASVTNNRDCSV